MSRKKMITFDSDEYLSLFKKKMKQKEDVCFQRMASLTQMKVDTVKSWYRSGRIPEYEKYLFDIYLNTGRKMKKEAAVIKEEAEQMTLDELIPDLPPVEDKPVYHIDANENVIDYPKVRFFIDHAFDRFGDFTPEVRIAYLQCLAQLLICDKEAR